ncbi:uncharacterized protein [Euphorbia lathyris]|uniref:uncharacterized protein isoform X2 n=1 Tax=Euphorbia lathyris TaxID=212925 RepID=UPI0033131B45
MVSPKPESGVNPFSTRGDPPKVFEHQQRRKDDERELDKDSSRTQYGRDSYRHSDRYSSRNSHGYSRHDEYSRREKCADEEERRFQASSRSIRAATYSDHTIEESEHGRSRDYLRNDDKCSRDKYDSSKHRSKDKDTESVALDRQKFRDKDASPDIPDKKDRDRRDRKRRDEKRDYRRSFGDHKSDRASYYAGPKGYRKDSSGLHHEGLHFRESYKNEQKELNGQKDGKKHNDSGSNRDKDRHSRTLQHEDETVYGFENQESLAKKPKLFSSDKDAEGKNANEKQKQVFEVDGKVHVNNSEAANDLNAAKVAAMKAAELVNKNLTGVGFMSTEQKKKLLWGNKKSTASQESGNRWDTPLFDDRERQEKFNKLMGVKGDVNVEHKPEVEGGDGHGRVQAEKQKEVQMDLEKQYTAGLRRRDGRTVGLGL